MNGVIARAKLQAYVPSGLLRAGSGAPLAPDRRSATGSVLIADLCGFTNLTEELEQSGRAGTDELTAFLDHTFGVLVDKVCAAGGDVVAFAGDSVLAVWEASPGASVATSECAAVRSALDLLQTHSARSGGKHRHLPIRIAVGSGELQRYEVGGIADRWMHMLAGDAVQHALDGDARRIQDRVVLPAAIARRILAELTGEWVDASHFAATAYVGGLVEAATLPSPCSSELLDLFVPEAIVNRLAAGPEQFVAEFRNVTAVFLGFDPMLPLVIERFQEVVQTVQQQLVRFEGTLYQIITDDKGLTIVAVFGVPPRSHDDDPLRALECVSGLLDRLDRSGVSARVAVSTGCAYCGDYGGTMRRQYGVIGQTMNRAAHLLAGTPSGTVICDDNTRQRARKRRTFSSLPEQRTAKSSRAFQRYLLGGTTAQAPPVPPNTVVGRKCIQRRLADYVSVLFDHDARAPMLVIEADAGMGKTTLLSQLRVLAVAERVDVVWSQGEIAQHATLTPLRPLLRVLRVREPNFELALGLSSLGLLRMIDPERYEEHAAVEALGPQIRMERLIELLRRWCGEVTRRTPLLCLIEDAHWIDSASQSVIGDLAGSIAGFGVVLAQRPTPRLSPVIRQVPREVLSLEPMSKEETGRILARRMGVSAVPDSVVDSIHRRSGGNPLFAEEIAGMLVERGDLVIAQGACRLRTSLRSLEQSAVPPSLESVIIERTDRLAATDQLTLKVASVLGRTVEETVLLRTRPEADRESLTMQLERLVAAGFFAPPTHGTFAFRHPLYQEVTYGALVRTQRESLHRRAAEALESAQETRPIDRARLAIHWEQSGDLRRALPLLDQAAAAALRAYANEESIDLHERVLVARRAVGDLAELDLAVARIEHNIGSAHANLARHELARDHFGRSLTACHVTTPDGGARLLGSVAVQLWHRLRRQVTGRGAAAPSGSDIERVRQAMFTMADLMAADLWLGDSRAYAHATFALSNLGDALEPSVPSAGSTSGLGYLLGMTPMRRLGEADMRRALADLEDARDAQMTTICRVMYGMFLTANGRPTEAVCVLRPAAELGATFDGGPWRHRSRFALAEAQLMHGLLEPAKRSFNEAAELARLGEPQVVGFAHALEALAHLRSGDVSEALKCLLGDDGVEDTRDNEAKLPLFASLGALAEVSVLACVAPWEGERAAREAESLADDWDDTATYFAGYFGHSGVLEWWLDAFERGTQAAEAHVELGLRRMARFARRYPGARPRLWSFEARAAWARGARGKARRRLARAVEAAGCLGLEWEKTECELRLKALKRGEMPLAGELYSLRVSAASKRPHSKERVDAAQ